VRSLSVLVRFFLLGMSGLLLAVAQAEPVEFNLPAQAADRALLDFCRQAKAEMIFSFDQLHQAKSAEVIGTYEPEDALSRLLRGTTFAARRNGPGKFIITTARRPTGAVRGRLLTPDGTGARGIQVVIGDTRQATTTDENGEYTFPAVPPGTYRLGATGTGYRPLQITDVHVAADGSLLLAAQTLHPADDTGRMDPFVVEGRTTRPRGFGRDDDSIGLPTAVGDLDLLRTEDDALPYVIFNHDQIARSGVVSINEFIQRNVLDIDASDRPPEQSPGTDFLNGFFVGGSTDFNLRSFGANETVVLVNGRRLPEVLTSTTNPNSSQQPDVNYIPLSLVQRIEVLPISASAIYSGDAVGGIINIVLRPDVNATEVTATYTNALRGFDAPQSSVSLQHGQALLGGALHVRMNATFTQSVPATEAELGYIQASLRAHPGTGDPFHRATPNVISADSIPLFGPGTSIVTSVAPGSDGTGGLAAFANRQGVASVALFDSPGGMANSSNSVDLPYGRRQQGASYFASATYDVRPWLQLGLDGIYTHTVANRGYGVFAGNLELSSTSPLNPFHQDVDVYLNEIAPRLGEGYNEARFDFSSVVLGTLFRLPAGWSASLDNQYGRSITRYRGVADVDSARWQQLVDAGIYNPLRDTEVYGPPPEFYSQVLKYYGRPNHFVTLGNYDTLDSALRITNQSLNLPTGSGAVNVGGDYRRNHLAPYTNEQEYGDGSLANVPTRLSGRTLQRFSIFGELQAPLLPAHWLPSWIREIQADVAVRYVAAASSEDTNVAPTGGLKIDFTGGFSFRASVATSNRLPPPNLSGTSTTQSSVVSGGTGDVTYTSVTDPLRGNQRNTQVQASDALNTNLHPESALTRTAGLAFERGQIQQFRASLDFTDTRKSGELSYLQAQDVVNLEDLLPGRVTRAPLAPGDPYTAGVITSVLTGEFNLAYRHSQSWSTSVDYAWTECLGGRLDLYGRWLYFQRYDLQVLPSTPVVDELRQPDGTTPGLLRQRLNFGAGWSSHDYGFGLDGHYFHSRILPLLQQADQGSDRINPFWQFDAYLQSDLTRWLPWKNSRFDLRGQLRVDNLFDAAPPTYVDDPANTGVQSYGDWRGRTYSLSVTAAF
jgi:iron complex outermembrane receptor protein